MGIADELKKLDDLRRNGTLTDEEFTRAKNSLLANPTAAANVDAGSFLEEQLVQVRHQNELARIDREWDIECRQYEIVGRYGSRFIPTFGAGIATALVGGIFGVFWTALAITMASMSTHIGREVGPITGSNSFFSILGTIFPLIGVLFMIVAVIRGIYFCVVAHNYRVAYRAYQQRHLKASLAEQVT